jgi:hypothetical protein
MVTRSQTAQLQEAEASQPSQKAMPAWPDKSNDESFAFESNSTTSSSTWSSGYQSLITEDLMLYENE